MHRLFLPAVPPSRPRSVFSVAKVGCRAGSAALKCISGKILPFCASVIFRKKRRKGLVRQPLEAP
nr:MAG TPA: hypothetical protein [Caudoviricetes sp.]